jgi:hypothetical protein
MVGIKKIQGRGGDKVVFLSKASVSKREKRPG